MPILPFKRVKVSEGLHVRISNHFYYTDFGVRGRSDMYAYGRRYVPSNVPGTGFFERESDSHSYRAFVRECFAKEYPNSYLRMLLGREPSFDRELKRVATALDHCDDERKRPILECYHNALTTARTEERVERIIRGVKDKMGHRSNKYMVSVLSHYKSKVAKLDKEIASLEYNVGDHCSEETYRAYGEMVEAFAKVASGRRTWHYNENNKEHYPQVFFDMGVFDFIRSKYFLPVMRDSNGVHYYILPDSVIVARSTVDFDIVPLKGMAFVFQDLSIEEPVEAISSRLGDAASLVKIPALNLTFYFNHVRPVIYFIEKMDALRMTL